MKAFFHVALWALALVGGAGLWVAAFYVTPRAGVAHIATSVAPHLLPALPRGSLPWAPPGRVLGLPDEARNPVQAHAPTGPASAAAVATASAAAAASEAVNAALRRGATHDEATAAGNAAANRIAPGTTVTVNDHTNVMAEILSLARSLGTWSSPPVWAGIHLAGTLGVIGLYCVLACPCLPATLRPPRGSFSRLVQRTALLSAWATIPLPALARGLPWFWIDLHESQYGLMQSGASPLPIRFGPLAFLLVWLGAGLIYLRLQVAITRCLLTRAVARLDADPHHCGRCGYARASGGTKCPECGWTYSTTDRYVPRLLRWPRGRIGRFAVEAAFWALVVVLLNAPYTLALACRFIPDSWERALAPWLNHYV